MSALIVLAVVVSGLLFVRYFVASKRFAPQRAVLLGYAGEKLLSAALTAKLDESQYRLLNNVTLPAGDGTTQIDHVLVSPYGIFVVETKFMKGWIFGSEHDRTWTQRFFRRSFVFQNPLQQNRKHVDVLARTLGVNPKKLHSVVFFLGGCVLKSALPANVGRFPSSLKFIQDQTKEILTPTQVAELVDKIESLRLPQTYTTYVNHVRYVQSLKNKRGVKAQNGHRSKQGKGRQSASGTAPRSVARAHGGSLSHLTDCPKCGSRMVPRKVKRGDRKGTRFLGCERFPRCRGAIYENAAANS